MSWYTVIVVKDDATSEKNGRLFRLADEVGAFHLRTSADTAEQALARVGELYDEEDEALGPKLDDRPETDDCYVWQATTPHL